MAEERHIEIRRIYEEKLKLEALLREKE